MLALQNIVERPLGYIFLCNLPLSLTTLLWLEMFVGKGTFWPYGKKEFRAAERLYEFYKNPKGTPYIWMILKLYMFN